MSQMRYSRLLRWGAIATPVTLVALSQGPRRPAPRPRPPRPAGQPAAGQPAASKPALTAAQAKALSANVTDKVIVVFKNQFVGLTDAPNEAAVRSAVVGSAQRGVLSQLSQ